MIFPCVIRATTNLQIHKYSIRQSAKKIHVVYLLKGDCSRVSSESCTVVQGLIYVLFPNIWQNAKHVDIDNRYISMDGEKIRQIMTQTNRLWLQPLLQPLCGQLHVSHENIVQVFICVLGQIKVLEAGGFGGGREGV